MLTGKQRHRLRALAHHQDPVVQIGKDGLTEAVVAQVDAALAAHELIKVRVGAESPVGRDEAARALGEALRADVAQTIGHVILLFRRQPKKPKVPLTAKAAARKQGKQSKKPPPGRSRRRGARAERKPRRSPRSR